MTKPRDLSNSVNSNSISGSRLQDASVLGSKISSNAPLIASNKLSFTQAGSGAVSRTVDSKLKDVVSVKDFGAVGDGVTDDTAAIQAAILATGTNGVVKFFGTHLVSAPIVSTVFGITLEGSGVGRTTINATHTTGPVLQFRRSFSTIRGMSIFATGARESASYTPSAVGVLIGDYDWFNPSNAPGPSAAFCLVQHCNIQRHPGHGLLVNAGGARVTNNNVNNNKGHGIYLDDGTSAGLLPQVIGFPGWTEIIQNRASFNGGHGICVGNPVFNVQPPYRVRVSNNDVSSNATDASVRNTDHQVYLVGEQVITNLNGIAGSSGMFVAGKGHMHVNNRFIETSMFAYSIGNIANYSTRDVLIDSFRVVASPSGLNPAVELDSTITSTASGVRIKNYWNANITNLVSASDVDKCLEVLSNASGFNRGGLRTWTVQNDFAVNTSLSTGNGLIITDGGLVKSKTLASDGTSFEVNKVDYTSGAADYFNFRINGARIGSIVTTNGTSTSYNTSSDYRLKDNLVPLTDSLSRISSIPVYRFNFKSNPGYIADGFIAHELATVVPDAVTGEKDELDNEGNPIYQGVDQSKVVPLLTAAVQELIKRLDNLESLVKQNISENT